MSRICDLYTAVLELIEIPEDDIAFIVQEEWSSQRVSGAPCSLFSMLNGIRECLLVCA